MPNRARAMGSEELTGYDSSSRDLDIDLVAITSLAGGEARGSQYTGTKALMLAILEDGIRNYLSPVGRLRSEAEFWVNSARNRSPFSFNVVCETLGLEPQAVRAALKRLSEQRVSPRRAIGRSRPNVRRTGRLGSRRNRRT